MRKIFVGGLFEGELFEGGELFFGHPLEGEFFEGSGKGELFEGNYSRKYGIPKLRQRPPPGYEEAHRPAEAHNVVGVPRGYLRVEEHTGYIRCNSVVGNVERCHKDLTEEVKHGVYCKTRESSLTNFVGGRDRRPDRRYRDRTSTVPYRTVETVSITRKP